MKKTCVFLAVCVCLAALGGCERKLGWGVVLWAQNDTGVPSGAVLPVFARSNIEKKWIAGIPREYRIGGVDKLEVPLSQLHLTRTRGAAKRWSARNLGQFAQAYAETLQDGLPVRVSPENGSQRVYRLRSGEIIKILQPADGVLPVGDNLNGQWFSVLTESGTRGYCFSARLRLFEHSAGELAGGVDGADGDATDAALDAVIAKKWNAADYWNMMNEKKFIIEDLEKHWGFSFGEDTGIANIYVSSLDRSFRYTSIRAEGPLKWRFEGTSLRVEQVAENQLHVEFTERSENYNGIRAFSFYALPFPVEDLIADEQARRETVYKAIYAKGPAFSGGEAGTFFLTEKRDFVWENYQAISPGIIPVSALGRGKVDLGYFLSDDLAAVYEGVLTFKFATVNGPVREVNFAYRLEGPLLDLVYAPLSAIQDRTVYMADEYASRFAFIGGINPGTL
ncbi:MAG: SH3 domain-containing protein [Spirochaetaceae bacterium]|nr:SH3 domain-containing protein [Spirochaetaceae bacterium]